MSIIASADARFWEPCHEIGAGCEFLKLFARSGGSRGWDMQQPTIFHGILCTIYALKLFSCWNGCKLFEGYACSRWNN